MRDQEKKEKEAEVLTYQVNQQIKEALKRAQECAEMCKKEIAEVKEVLGTQTQLLNDTQARLDGTLEGQVTDLKNQLEKLDMKRKISELKQRQFQDEIDRLENFGAIRVFDDTTAMDYLTIGGSNGPAYHPIGSEEYQKELDDERKAKERKLTIKEARELGNRLMKRREHDHYCTCNLCEPNGATDHIK